MKVIMGRCIPDTPPQNDPLYVSTSSPCTMVILIASYRRRPQRPPDLHERRREVASVFERSRPVSSRPR